MLDGGDASRVDFDSLDNTCGASKNRITRASVDTIQEVRAYASSFSVEFGQAKDTSATKNSIPENISTGARSRRSGSINLAGRLADRWCAASYSFSAISKPSGSGSARRKRRLSQPGNFAQGPHPRCGTLRQSSPSAHLNGLAKAWGTERNSTSAIAPCTHWQRCMEPEGRSSTIHNFLR